MADPFKPKYTPEQRAAVPRAILDEGKSVAETLELARQGKLAGLAPFNMPPSTAYDLRRREIKRRRRRRNSPMADVGGRVAAENLRRRALILAEIHLRHAEQKAESGKLTTADLGRITSTVLTIADRLERKLDPPDDRGQDDRAGADPEPPDILEQLAELERESNGAEPDPTTTAPEPSSP